MRVQCGDGNATPDIKAAADYVTITNEEEGVVYAIRTLLFREKDGVPPRASLRRRLAAWMRGRR